MRIWLIVVALALAIASLMASHKLIGELRSEEQKKMEVWAEALRTFANADSNADLPLVFRVLEQNTTIPTIVQMSDGTITEYRNIEGTEEEIRDKADSYMASGDTIRIPLSHDEGQYLYVLYANSSVLRNLAIYPYVLLGVLLLFCIVAIVAILSLKRSEQNKVWVGLSKETAHQLGTPISSLMAWNAVLAERYPGDELPKEMSKDVERLQLVAERFSKIGTGGEAQLCDLGETIEGVVNYLQPRISKQVTIEVHTSDCQVSLRRTLFEWVLEVLLKNAVDAMSGKGKITVSVSNANGKAYIDVEDTGKGIPSGKFNEVFAPGYTTKQRGWGLGLSLARRIINDYHRGRIYVLRSELGHGTTFRIELTTFAS